MDRKEQARAMRAEGATFAAIAAEFGVSKQSARRWCDSAVAAADKAATDACKARPEYRAAQRRYQAAYCRSDHGKAVRARDYQRPEARLANRFRKRLARCVESVSRHSADLVGCSWEELRAHLEAQFAPGMSWANQGEWHVDHVVPCAAFDLKDPEQVALCFHFSNLQPLWAVDNLRKGARL